MSDSSGSGQNLLVRSAMKFKYVTRAVGTRELVAVQTFEMRSLAVASHLHGDIWNANFAWTDRFRSTMYILDELSRRWQKAEVIN